jgi:hypothetical protein
MVAARQRLVLRSPCADGAVRTRCGLAAFEDDA